MRTIIARRVGPSASRRLMQGITAIGLSMIVAAAGQARANPTVIQNDSQFLGIQNTQGKWWISKTCIPTSAIIAHPVLTAAQLGTPTANGRAGAGYIFFAQDSNNRTLVNDWNHMTTPGYNPPTTLGTYPGNYFASDPWGGLLNFAYHHIHSSLIPPFGLQNGDAIDGNGTPIGNANLVMTRWCSQDVEHQDVTEAPTRDPNQPSLPTLPGFGVSVAYPPTVTISLSKRAGQACNGYCQFGISVPLKSPWADPALTVNYNYKFYDTYITVDTTVTINMTMTSGQPSWEYAKEPKYTVEVDKDYGLNAFQVYKEVSGAAQPIIPLDGPNNRQGSRHGIKSTTDSRRSTFQFAQNNRYYARLEHLGMNSRCLKKPTRKSACPAPTGSTCPAGCTFKKVYSWSCDGTIQCLRVRAVALDNNATPNEYPWESQSTYSAFGLDKWAWDVNLAVSAGPETVAGGMNAGNCHADSLYGYGTTTIDQNNRRWEGAGNMNPLDHLNHGPSFYFHGWEGGSGPNDCEPLTMPISAVTGKVYKNRFKIEMMTQ